MFSIENGKYMEQPVELVGISLMVTTATILPHNTLHFNCSAVVLA